MDQDSLAKHLGTVWKSKIPDLKSSYLNSTRTILYPPNCETLRVIRVSPINISDMTPGRVCQIIAGTPLILADPVLFVSDSITEFKQIRITKITESKFSNSLFNL